MWRRTAQGLISLLLTATVSGADPVKKTRKTVQTPQGTIEWKEWEGAKGSGVAAVLRDLSREERASLQRDADRASDFISEYVPKHKRQNDLLEDLDAAFTAWTSSPLASRRSVEDVVRVTGSAYGHYCVQNLGFRWAVVRDEHGTATALVRDQPPTRVFPFTSIQYRIEDRKTDFLVAMYVALTHTVDKAIK